MYQASDRDRRVQDEVRPTVHDRLGKRMPDHDWPDYEWDENQCCPSGLTKSQKKRVQRLRCKELEKQQNQNSDRN
jgi:hypothetical protein